MIVGISFAEIYKTLGHKLKYGGYIEYSKNGDEEDATDYYDFKFDNILIGCDGEDFEIIEDSKVNDIVILKAVESEGNAIIRLSQQEFGVGCFSSTYHNS